MNKLFRKTIFYAKMCGYSELVWSVSLDIRSTDLEITLQRNDGSKYKVWRERSLIEDVWNTYHQLIVDNALMIGVIS